ncbi:hypothetical protein [Mycolicibacterium parafortuitum]|uniref:hypothetical protein n=1 Tax=Mycolicibacterium parafortuitum TaxID=39692 RepID=UPI000CF1CFD7|nr:hypothetical protein CYL16_10175 [Mycobacterium sp. EPG1]
MGQLCRCAGVRGFRRVTARGSPPDIPPEVGARSALIVSEGDRTVLWSTSLTIALWMDRCDGHTVALGPERRRRRSLMS